MLKILFYWVNYIALYANMELLIGWVCSRNNHILIDLSILFAHDIKPNRMVEISRMLKCECIGEVTVPLILQPQEAGQRADKGACQWDMIFFWHFQESNWQPVPSQLSALRFHLATVTGGSYESPRIQQVL